MFVGADTETHAFEQGWMVPRVVCLTLATTEEDTPKLQEMVEHAGELVGWEHVRRRPLAEQVPDVCTDAFLLGRKAAKVIWPWLLEETDLVWHNAAFDLRVMMMLCPESTRAVMDAIEDNRMWDTVHREKLLANAVGQLKMRIDPFTGKATQKGLFSLATLVMKYFNVDLREEKTDPDAWRLRYAELDGVPVQDWPEGAASYAMMDAVWPLHLLGVQNGEHPEEIGGHPTRCVIDERVSPGLPGLPEGIRRFAGEYHLARGHLAHSSAACWGLRTDPERVDSTVAAWIELAAKGAEIGADAGFVRVEGRDKGKPGSKDLKVLRGMISKAYGVPPQLDESNWDAFFNIEMYTPKGALKYNKAVLSASGDPVLVDYETCVSATNWMTKYAPMLQSARTTPLTYGVDPLKSTGRISIFKPPLHQPPREGGFRECHVARPGYVYLIADYDQAELRGLAQIHHWWGLGEGLRNMFLEGIDPHSSMAVSILQAEGRDSPKDGNPCDAWDYALFRACLAGDHGDAWKKTAKFYRHLAKAANFGLPGGLGARTFMVYARGLGVTDIDMSRAELVKSTWKEQYPENVAYLQEINNRLGDMSRFTIRQAHSARVRGGCTYTSGANAFFQGLVADGFNYTAWLLYREMYTDRDTALYGCRTALPLHDEFIVEAPEDRASEAAKRLVEVMKEGMALHIPDVPITTEAAMTKHWYKGAKSTYDTDGNLTLWAPKEVA